MPRASGAATITAAGMSTPALVSSARPALSSTTPSAGRSPRSGSRVARWVPSQTPGSEPIRIVAVSSRSTLPENRWAIAATHSRIGGVEDVGADDAPWGEPEAEDQADRDERARAGGGEAEDEADATPRGRPRRPCGASRAARSARSPGAVADQRAKQHERAGQQQRGRRSAASRMSSKPEPLEQRARRRDRARDRSRAASHQARLVCDRALAQMAGSRRRSW